MAVLAYFSSLVVLLPPLHFPCFVLFFFLFSIFFLLFTFPWFSDFVLGRCLVSPCLCECLCIVTMGLEGLWIVPTFVCDHLPYHRLIWWIDNTKSKTADIVARVVLSIGLGLSLGLDLWNTKYILRHEWLARSRPGVFSDPKQFLCYTHDVQLLYSNVCFWRVSINVSTVPTRPTATTDERMVVRKNETHRA